MKTNFLKRRFVQSELTRNEKVVTMFQGFFRSEKRFWSRSSFSGLALAFKTLPDRFGTFDMTEERNMKTEI